jgi:hypothetical protein
VGILGDQLADSTIPTDKLDSETQAAVESTAAEVVPVDGAFAVPASAQRQLFANPNATETTIATLPDGGTVPASMEVGFIRNSPDYAFQIVPGSSEKIIFGGNVDPFHGALRPGAYMELGENGSFLYLKRTADGNWTSVGEGGVLNPSPPPYPQFQVGNYIYQGLSTSSPDGIETDVVLLDYAAPGHRIYAIASNYLGGVQGGPSGNVYADGGANTGGWSAPLTIGFQNRSLTTPLVVSASALLRLNFDIAVPPCPYALTILDRENDIVVPPPTFGFRNYVYFVDIQGRLYLGSINHNGAVEMDYTYEEASFVNGPA